jgi:DNA-binding MarR family transcriptional regulator
MIVHMERSINASESTPGAVEVPSVVGITPTTPDSATAIVAGPYEDIMGTLRTAFGELRCVASERMVREGMSMTTLHVLSILDHHNELSMSHLAELLDVSLSNATGLVDRMEERGFVERERDRDDRRVVVVRLSAEGRQKLLDVQLVKEDFIAKVLARLDPDALGCVRSAIESIRGAATAVAADPDVAAHWHAHTH